jgi:hypothetical protein
MARRQCSHLLDIAIEEHRGGYYEHTGPHLKGGCEGVIKFRFGAYSQNGCSPRVRAAVCAPFSSKSARGSVGLTRSPASPYLLQMGLRQSDDQPLV